MISWREFLPRDWRDLLAQNGRVGIGIDVATTAKKTSNPTGLALVQEVGADYFARLVLRFKTQDSGVIYAILEELLDLPHGLRVRKVCVDATNERFFAADLRKDFAGKVVVEPMVQSETMTYKGEKMTVKAFLGQQLVNTVEDGHLLLPNEKWLERDIRQVKRAGGSFEADVDADGNHADAFDGIKFALHAAMSSGGRAEASAAPTGTLGQPGRPRWWKNPFAKNAGESRRNLT